MKKFSVITAIASVALLFASCEKDATAPSIVSVDVNEKQYDTEIQEVWISGLAQTISAEITGTDPVVASPTADSWITPYINEGKLYVRVEMNEGDAERTSHVDLIAAGTKARLSIRQDFIRTLSFVSTNNNVDASDGTYRIPVATNIAPEDITVTVTEGDWITSASVVDGFVVIQAEANPSGTDERVARIKIDATITDDKTGNTTEYSTVTRVTQSSMSGFPYVIDVAAMDLETYPVYDVYDRTNDIYVAQVAKEYLYKYDAVLDITTVDASLTVAYPVADGKVNYEKGLVLENNGEVSWKSNITSDDRGRDMISFYADGGETLTPSKVYLARGSKSLRLKPLSDTDAAKAVAVEAVPLKLVDHKEGAADSAGKTVEEYTYPIVKIGCQYWLKDNYKSSRFADGSPIPTPMTRGNETTPAPAGSWVACFTSPVTVLKPLVVVANGSSRYWDANSDNAKSTRDLVGCSYTYAALLGRDMPQPQGSDAKPAEVDRISPDGYKVPSPLDYEILTSYLIQRTGLSNQDILTELTNKCTASSGNISGFSARGNAQVGASGGYNSYTYYLTMDYVWTGSAHAAKVYQLTARNSSYLLNLGTSSAVYLRLLKK